MYRHMLVPVDDTDLSIELIGNAVGLARTLGARVTFFHAVADEAASLGSDAEIMRATSPEDFAYAFAGKAREILAKAEAAARAHGVPCDSVHAVEDRPASAIVAAARSHGCDLIVMASHGRRSRLGMALGSQTLAVLMNAGTPVLVASASEPSAPARAIGIIRDEHRSLAAVLHAWMHALAAARQADATPDLRVMRGIVHYVRSFPVALHHPKEEEHLFERLRSRTSAVNPELEELERQHERDRALVDELAGLVERLANPADVLARRDAVAALEAAVSHYATFLWDHMGREEGVILPAAQRHLRPEDWKAIDAAFAENGDPRFGGETDREYRHLFSRIVNLEEAKA